MSNQQPAIGGTEPAEGEVEGGGGWGGGVGGGGRLRPRCGGAYGSTHFRPLRHEVEEDGVLWLCTCKRTATPPYCDGSHNSLEAD